MKTSSVVAGLVSLVVVTLVACKKDDPPPAVPLAQPATPNTTQPQPGQPGYQQPGYAPASSAVPGQMAVPGPTALSCQNDSACMLHHCNMQYQKCAFPCVSDTDCIQGARCMVALGPLAFCSQ